MLHRDVSGDDINDTILDCEEWHDIRKTLEVVYE